MSTREPSDTPSDYPDVDYNLAQWLHTQGICADPDDVQAEGDLPAVWLHPIPHDAPDRSIALYARTLFSRSPSDPDSDDANPEIQIQVVVRGEPHDLQWVLGTHQRIYGLLHQRDNYRLTATQGVLLSRRLVKGAMGQDYNRRYVRVDSYLLRPTVTTTNTT